MTLHWLCFHMSDSKMTVLVCLSLSACVYKKINNHFYNDESSRWVFLEDQGKRIAELDKHSWGHTVLVALQLRDPLQTLSVCLFRGCPLIFTSWSPCKVFAETQKRAGIKGSLSTGAVVLIPPQLNLNVLVFIQVIYGLNFVWLDLFVGGKTPILNSLLLSDLHLNMNTQGSISWSFSLQAKWKKD